MKKFNKILILTCLLVKNIYAEEPDKEALQTEEDTQSVEDDLDAEQSISLQKNPKPFFPPTEDEGAEKDLVEKVEKTLSFLRKTEKSLTKNSPARLRLLERMLNLSFEQAAFVTRTEQYDYEKNWKAWDKSERKGLEPKLSNNKSLKYWRDIEKTAHEIIKDFPNTKGQDKILFHSALASKYLGQDNKAISTYQKIISEFPKTTFRSDIFFELAEYFYDKSQHKESLSYYLKVTHDPEAKKYGWALYKAGWCAFNLKNYQEAMKFWKKTISDNSERVTDTIKEEALRDLILVYVQNKNLDDAQSFFKKHSGNKYFIKLLFIVARSYLDEKKIKEAAKVFDKILSLDPNSYRAFEVELEIADTLYQTDARDLLWTRLKNLPERYISQSSWTKKNKLETRKKAREKTKEALLRYAKIYHQKGQKNSDIKDYKFAEDGYILFLDFFEKEQHDYSVQQLLADVYYLTHKYEKAGDTYKKIVEAGKEKAFVYEKINNKDVRKNIHALAAKNMLDAYSKLFTPEFQILVKKNADFSQPEKISPNAEKFMSGCHEFLKYYSSEKVIKKQCDTFIADIYYRTGNLKEAEKELENLSKEYAHEDIGKNALEKLIFINKKDPDRIISLIDNALKNPAYKVEPFSKKLREIHRRYLLERIAKETSAAKRAQGYEKLALADIKSVDAPQLLYNAANEYLKAKEVEKVVVINKKFLVLFPYSDLAATLTMQVAQLYELKLNDEKSAYYYNLFATRFSKAKDAGIALQNACQLYISIKSSHIFSVCQTFIDRYPTLGINLIEVAIEDSYLSNDYKRMYLLLNKLYLPRQELSAEQRVVAYSKIARGFGTSSSLGKNAKQQIISISQKTQLTGEALQRAGEILYTESSLFKKSIDGISLLGGDVHKLQTSLKNYYTKLLELENAYAPIFKAGDAYWGVNALYDLATFYEKFANQLANPPEISGAKHSDVKTQLKPTYDQIKQKSDNFYQNILDTSEKLTVLNPIVPIVWDKIKKTNQQKISNSLPHLDLVGVKINQGIAITE